LHVYVVPPALWQERLHSAFNQIIGETVRSDIERQLGYEIVPRNFVFCKSVGRCLTQVRSRQEKELKVKHFLPPHAYCPEIFVLDYDIARRSQSSSDGSIASNRSYPNHRALQQPQRSSRQQQQQPPLQQQNFDSPRQTVYHGRTPKVAHKGITGVYIGPYPMQSYPGLGSRPGTADSQSRSPVPFDSGLDMDYEELESKAQAAAAAAGASATGAEADDEDSLRSSPMPLPPPPPPPPPFDESPLTEPPSSTSER
uniref:KH_dom_type_1 domain-containing protein n=1 Tax=Macrostomum lignano TaxID=282301 RepID=A0A1I8I6D8_9PLAT